MNNSKIPYVRAARVGNFKIWRTRMPASIPSEGKSRRQDIECLCVSSLDGTWRVQIPASFEMYAVLNALYDDYSSDVDEVHSRADDVLSTILSNMMYATIIGNGYYHQALLMVSTVYAHPSYLSDGDEHYKALCESYAKLRDGFTSWRKEYDSKTPVSDDVEGDTAEKVADFVAKEEENKPVR